MIEMQQPFSFPPHAFHVKRKKASLIPSAEVSTHFHSSVRGPAISVTPLPLVLLSPPASYFSLEKNNSQLQKIRTDFLGNTSVRKAWTVTMPRITQPQSFLSLISESFATNFKQNQPSARCLFQSSISLSETAPAKSPGASEHVSSVATRRQRGKSNTAMIPA